MKQIFSKHHLRRLNQVQFIAAGFFMIVLVGTCLLMLPIASRSGEWSKYRHAMITAT